MPFVFDQTEVQWPEDVDDFEPPSPRVDQFVYLSPPDFGGAPDPVRFSIEPALETGEPPPPARRPPPVPQPPRGILDILLGRPRPPAQPPQPVSYVEIRQQRERESERRRQQLFAIAIPELRKVRMRRAYCRYDGGNDEGFSWPESFEMRDGERVNTAELAHRLRDARLPDKVYAAGAMHSPVASGPGADTESERIAAVLERLCEEWASMLLGDGFGTGEYSMYGAFTVDVDACTITDDRNAGPVVDNIHIST